MIEHIEHSTIELDGQTHIVLKEEVFRDLLRMAGSEEMIPHEVVSSMVDGRSPMKAWREHLGLNQDEVAQKLGISQPAYAQIEKSQKPRKKTIERVAAAFGISPEQLDV